jgi:hypothetical protein
MEVFTVRGVKRGEERQPVDPACLRYLPADGVWTFDFHSIEFVVAGGPDGPDSVRLDVARFVAARLDEFVSEANGYLAAFVVPERFEASGTWDLQSVEFGRAPDDPPDVFELMLVLDGDTYGLWGVRFKLSDPPLDCFYPVQFCRRQW